MKPDWSSKNVPDWANYAAQEASGSWYWYSHRPNYSEICTEWQSPGQRQIIPKVELRPQETLEERPPYQYPLVITPTEAKEIENTIWRGAIREAFYAQQE